MKLNLLLGLIALASVTALAIRWHIWRNEQVLYWDGKFPPGKKIVLFPPGTYIWKEIPTPGYYARRGGPPFLFSESEPNNNLYEGGDISK